MAKSRRTEPAHSADLWALLSVRQIRSLSPMRSVILTLTPAGVVGYGTEGVIDFWGAHNWTWKIEGLYMDLGHLDTTGSGGSTATGAFVPPVAPTITVVGTGQTTTHSHFTDGILRAGLNYKFY